MPDCGASLSDFEVDPPVSDFCRVLFDEFGGNVRDLYSDILRIWHRNVQIEILEVNGAEASAFS
jgi:hypothetical protein